MTHTQPVVAVLAVVDDDERVRQSLDELLASAGYKVRPYSSGEEFLAARALADVDCIVSDVVMPGMSGLDLLRVVKVESPSLPVILISGHGIEEIKRSALSIGAALIIAKPFEGAAILTAIGSLLSDRGKGIA